MVKYAGFSRIISEILSSRHIENPICICYNAYRQREIISPYKMANENPGAAISGVFYSYFWQWEGLGP